ncbi:MAG: RnfABCDGE type electron transport complex subunit B [Dokdonella sp.]|uniref:RnfABCDGE type electron transport complex subunit B n=1 Tax=Dokdonella sp. TaxID=2291710 RepID=UPI0032658DB3
MSLADRIDAVLPQTQCTRCGYPTCAAYAHAIANENAGIDRCPPGGADGVKALARVTGRSPVPLDPTYGLEQPALVAIIDEDVCIGCTKCIQACPVDAIVGAAKRMHTIIAAECTGCELCLPPCPVDCIALVPIGTTPPPRSQVLETAARARSRYENRERRFARAADVDSVGAASAAMVSGIPSKSNSAEAAPTTINASQPLSRSAVLDAIARGKAKRAGRMPDPSDA